MMAQFNTRGQDQWAYRSHRPLNFLRVDLGALQAAAEVDIHRLPFGEDVERSRPGLAMAVAGCLRTAERQMHLRADRRRVDVENPGVHIAHGCERAIDILSVDRSRQAVLHAVAYRDSLIEGSTGNHRDDRTEDFLLRD